MSEKLELEVEALKREIHEVRELYNLFAGRDTMANAIKRAKEALKDKERLDWLLNNNRDIFSREEIDKYNAL